MVFHTPGHPSLSSKEFDEVVFLRGPSGEPGNGVKDLFSISFQKVFVEQTGMTVGPVETKIYNMFLTVRCMTSLCFFDLGA